MPHVTRTYDVVVDQIVDLGCGWGSLTLFLAEKYPNSSITSISNSASQKAHIDGQCKVRETGTKYSTA